MPILDVKNESLAPDVGDHRRILRSVDLAPKPAHMHVHEVGLWNELILPHLSEEHFTRKCPAFVTHHVSSNDMSVLLEAAKTHLGIALLSNYVALPEIRRGSL
jgi:DNA-binding transcriptional LysR family regulator